VTLALTGLGSVTQTGSGATPCPEDSDATTSTRLGPVWCGGS